MQGFLLKHENGNSKDTLLLLAHMWTTQINAVLRENAHLPKGSIHFIHLEDLILKPRETTQGLFRFIGIPLSPAVEHRALTIAHTATKTVTAWKREMDGRDAEQIQDICADVMIKLGYDVN